MNSVRHEESPVYRAMPTVTTMLQVLRELIDEAGLENGSSLSTDITTALLEVPRSWPSMNRDAEIDPAILARGREAVQRVARGEPFAYAVGTAQFRHLTLNVDSRVLIPRPETEVLVTEVLEIFKARFNAGESWGVAVDVGTGSGAIALALASEGVFERVVATDVSLDALEVAKSNARRSVSALKCDVEFRQGSFIAPVAGVKATLLVSNPPYIAYSELDALPTSVRDWEPPLALTSGHDGLAATKEIITEGAAILVSGGILALEVDERRASLVSEIVMNHGGYSNVGVRLDLAGRERIVLATRN